MGTVVIVGTEKGGFICRSENKREWTVEGPLFKGWKLTATTRSPSGRWLAATASRVYGAAVHVSDDLKEWRQIENGPAWAADSDRKMNQIWTLRAGANRHFAGVDQAGLFLSEDDGESWQPVPALNEHASRPNWFPGAGGLCAHVVLVDPNDEKRVWVGISAVGVWRTDDGGETWLAKNEGIRVAIEDKEFKDIGFCVHALAQQQTDGDVLWRQDHTGMYRSTDGGDHWTACMEGLPSWFGFPVVRDPDSGRLFCFPMESDEYRMPVKGDLAVYTSDDRGDSWQRRAEGLPTHPCWAGVLRGAMAHDGGGGIYFGDTAGAVYASADGAESWQALPCTLPRVLSIEAFTV